MHSRIMMAMFTAGVTQEGKHISSDDFFIGVLGENEDVAFMMGGNLHECFSVAG